jgi:hypothetical protein
MTAAVIRANAWPAPISLQPPRHRTVGELRSIELQLEGVREVSGQSPTQTPSSREQSGVKGRR